MFRLDILLNPVQDCRVGEMSYIPSSDSLFIVTIYVFLNMKISWLHSAH